MTFSEAERDHQRARELRTKEDGSQSKRAKRAAKQQKKSDKKAAKRAAKRLKRDKKKRKAAPEPQASSSSSASEDDDEEDESDSEEAWLAALSPATPDHDPSASESASQFGNATASLPSRSRLIGLVHSPRRTRTRCQMGLTRRRPHQPGPLPLCAGLSARWHRLRPVRTMQPMLSRTHRCGGWLRLQRTTGALRGSAALDRTRACCTQRGCTRGGRPKSHGHSLQAT